MTIHPHTLYYYDVHIDDMLHTHMLGMGVMRMYA